VTLDCIALARSLPAWQRGDLRPVRATLSVSVDRLARAGADFFACPDNTAHMALEQPGPSLALPGLHIAEVVAEQAARHGHQRVGLLGTKYTSPASAGLDPAAGSRRLRHRQRPSGAAHVARRSHRGLSPPG
jgi:hypothetical protein